MVDIVGGSEIERVDTGIWSLNKALRGGYPLRTICQIYGHTHVGKSTFGYYLFSLVGKDVEGDVSLCDWEGFDPTMIAAVGNHNGYGGTVYVTPNSEKKKDKYIPQSHSSMAQASLEMLKAGTVRAVMFDSVSAFIPDGEQNGDIGEAFMGQRAKAIGQIVRKSANILNSEGHAPSTVIFINHKYQNLGTPGSNTAGGVVLDSLSQLKIMLWQSGTVKTTVGGEEETLAYIIEGAVEKLRYGGKGGKFRLINLPGYGIDRNLSAVFDCIACGLATRDTVVKLGDKSFGYMRDLVESAKDGDDDKFSDFHLALQSVS